MDAPGATGLVLDVVWKSAVLFAATLAGLLLLRRASAAARHLFALAGLAGALALPALIPLLPRLELAALPRITLPFLSAPPSRSGAPPASRPVPVRPEISPLTPPAPDLWGGIDAPAPASSGASSSAPPRAAIPWALLLGAAWAVGSLPLLLRLATGALRVRRLARDAEPLTDPDALHLVLELPGRVGLARPVPVLVSEETPVAVTAGLLSPVLLLPAAARSWSPERLRVVLLHELAHVKRGDWSALLLSQVAVAIYWFQPLTWLIASELRCESEQASDDVVLASGIKPSVYAGHLLAIVRALRSTPPRPLAAVPVVRSGQFERRLRGILEPRRQRDGSARRLAVRAAAVGVPAAVAFLAALAPRTPAESAVAADSFSAERTFRASADGSRPPGGPDRATCPRGGEKERRRNTASVVATADAATRDSAELSADRKSCAKEEEPDGTHDAAVLSAALPEAPSEETTDPEDGWYSRGMDLHRDARYQQAIEAFRRALELGDRADDASYNIACGYARLGERDRAFEWLARASALGFELDGYLASDSDLDSLRSDPRFAALAARHGVAAETAVEEVRIDSPPSDDTADAAGGSTRPVYRSGKQLVRGLRRAGRALSQSLGPSRRDPRPAEEWREAAAQRRAYAQAHPDCGLGWFRLGLAELKASRAEASADAFARALALGYRPQTTMYNLACAAARSGQIEKALDWLGRALEAGFPTEGLIDRDEDLNAIRSDPRFLRTLRAARSRRTT